MPNLSILNTILCIINGQSEYRANIIVLFDDENETVTIFRKAKTQWSPLTLVRLQGWAELSKNGTDTFASFEDLKSFISSYIVEDTSGGGGGVVDTNKYVKMTAQSGTMLMHTDFMNRAPILIVVDSVPLLSGFSKPTLASNTINITADTVMNDSNVLVLLR